MKFFIILAAFVAASYGSLREDLNDFHALIPVDEVRSILEDYLSNDPEVQALAEYVQSPDAINAGFAVYSIDEIQQLAQWILENWVHAGFNYRAHPRHMGSSQRGVSSCFQEILAVLPIEDLIALAKEKIADGGSLSQLYFKIKARPDVYEEIISLPEVVKFNSGLAERGVNVQIIDKYIRKAFGW